MTIACFLSQEVLKNLDRMDEGALATINSWVLKVQDDSANQAMVREAYGGGETGVVRGCRGVGWEVGGGRMGWGIDWGEGVCGHRFIYPISQPN